jgi:hypothetical protein
MSANNDIVLSDYSISCTRDINAGDNVVGDVVASGTGNDNNYSTRCVNEAFADFISAWVTGLADSSWLANGPSDNDRRFRLAGDKS